MAPIKLVTVNTVPARAKRIVGIITEQVKDKYEIVHVVNVDRIDDVKTTVEKEQPDLLFTASMWTAEQAQEIVTIAKETKPGLKTLSAPAGMLAEKGPQAIIDYVKENLPKLVDQ